MLEQLLLKGFLLFAACDFLEISAKGISGLHCMKYYMWYIYIYSQTHAVRIDITRPGQTTHQEALANSSFLYLLIYFALFFCCNLSSCEKGKINELNIFKNFFKINSENSPKCL